MSTFFASFENAAQAERAARALLSEGVTADEISIVVHDTDGAGSVIDRDEPIEPMEDATSIVGRKDDPEVIERLGGPQAISEMNHLREAPIGMGIGSHGADDSADNYDQSDNSQELAEDMIRPDADRPHSRHEVDDLQLALDTGFPTPVPIEDDVQDTFLPNEESHDHRLESIVIPGYGRVMGGGAFATAALDLTQDPNGTDSLMNHLVDRGVNKQAANDFTNRVRQGGAVLAVELQPARIKAEVVEDIATRAGAVESGTYDAPRYYDHQKPTMM